ALRWTFQAQLALQSPCCSALHETLPPQQWLAAARAGLKGSDFLKVTLSPSPRVMQHAATVVIGGKKGWPCVKSWTKPSFHYNDVV
ncbi:unnamed protein product, partial [Closterium sp. Naga37s-1]